MHVHLPEVMKLAIFQCEKNKDKVARLVKRIKELGSDVEVFEDEPAQSRYSYPAITTYAFIHVATALRSERFLWLESDSIPITDDWLSRIERYDDVFGVEHILAPARSKNPHDVASGICVYPKGIVELLPPIGFFEVQPYAFDLWLERNLSERIVRTPHIQHSYGIYDYNGHASPHRFPRDNHILKKETVLFHADKHQDLLALTDHERDELDSDMSFELPMPVA